MRINTNIMALNAYNNLENTSTNLSSSLQKLSSGYRINKAADDASGLVISENLKSQISGLSQATSNAQDGISVVQTAEGALSSVQSMLQRMRDLVIESANTGASDSTARQAAQNEIVQLRNEIDRVANTTSFGNEHLLDGSFGAQEARAVEDHDRPRRRSDGDGNQPDVRPEHRLRLRQQPLGHGHRERGHLRHGRVVPGRAAVRRQRADCRSRRLHRLGDGQRA